MVILVSGAGGLLGSHLCDRLIRQGYQVLRLRRAATRSVPDEIVWDPLANRVDVDRLEGLDAVVHLAGENIAGGRWTQDRKQRIRDSRVRGTRLLCEAVTALRRPPRVFLSCSAIGYYGDCGDEVLTETSPPGQGFLAGVCQEWEAAADLIEGSPTRLVKMRLGVVLTSMGGALSKMLPVFRLGLGGRLGSGQQYFSWITLDDVTRAMEHCLRDDNCRGVFNLTSPHPVTNLAFTQALGKILRRPAVLPLPRWAARLALGEMADEMLYFSQRAVPRRLLETGFAFESPTITEALAVALKK